MSPFEQQSYYDLLEVPLSATPAQIEDAYARALETYSPDSVAIYTLVDPGQIDALRDRLTLARNVLCALEQRLDYDRTLGVTRSPEELAVLRAESLRRAAGGDLPEPETVPEAVAAPTPAPVEAVVEIQLQDVLEEVAVEVKPEPAAPPVMPAVQPATPLPNKPLVHARPSAPVGRHGGGSVVPPPLPTRKWAARPAAPGPSEGDRPRLRPSSGPQLGDAPVLAQASAIATAESALAQVAMKVRDSRTRLKTIVDVPADAEFNGELLRKVREGRSVSLQLLAERTRISVKHVENIEADRYDVLPASVYLRGILMSIARELGLDPQRVSRSYMELVSSTDKKRR
ncbi:helix-turn-helix domain-containing protein [Archangium primigenium]|uniref:helix-turn-helix domain-containing protein n=1 Tax=[Archangium] primigenium TaxID=2792470 RepID=UPI00195D770F|nr:helix-turn-helix domain-containing protein [Archangium primigenium]MBM7117145.1 helix-turn-helix domain-containing protein [Archangium primigenium]